MNSPAASSAFSRRGIPPAAILTSLGALALLTAALLGSSSPTSPTSVQVSAVLSVCIAPVATLSYLFMAGEPVEYFLLTPAGIVLMYLWTALLTVPVLWLFGLATPWVTFPIASTTTILLTGCGLTAIVSFGAYASRSKPGFAPSLDTTGKPLLAVALATLILGLSAGFVSVRVGGFSFLLQNLLEKRDILAGLGPFTALAATGAVAAVFVAQLRRPTRALVFFGVISGLMYASYLFAMGSRFPLLAFLLAPIVARTAQGRTPRKALVALLAAIIPFSVWYSVVVRKGQELTEQTPGLSGDIRRVVDPFVYGGVDVIHTYGVVTQAQDRAFGFDAQTLLANLTTMLPTFLWPSKPSGLSVRFSEQYFSTAWSGGSGVPPSILAELLHLYGTAGACIAALVVGFLLSRLGSLRASRELFVRLLFPFLTVDSFVLAKSGTDAFFQQLTLHAIGSLIFVVLLRLTGTHIKMEHPNDQTY